MLTNVARYGALGLVGGTIAGSVIKPKTQSGEHAANKFSTAVGLGALATTPYLVKQAVKANPKSTLKIAHKTGEAIEKGAEYAVKYGKKGLDYIKKAAETKTGSKIMSFAQKLKKSKIGSKVMDKIYTVTQKISKNATVQKTVTKIAEGLKTFAKSSTTKKGLIGLAAAGIALLAYAGLKTITNYYKKEGAIDQKYKDIEVMNQVLA